MAESFINLTEGSGKKAHTYQRVIGSNTVEDEVTLAGEPYLATACSNLGNTASLATLNDHACAINAGASLNLYVRRIMVFQSGLASSAAIGFWELWRTTGAPSGGTVLVTSPFDTADTPTYSARALPTTKGTETTRVMRGTWQLTQTVAAQAPGFQAGLILDLDFDRLRSKPIKIPAGTTNGLALKVATAISGATVVMSVIVDEANF